MTPTGTLCTDMKGITMFLLVAWWMVLVQSHILIEEKPDRNNGGHVARLSELLPPISIVDLTKASRRVSRLDAEKNKLAKRKLLPKKKTHPPPPANCVPLQSSCKPPVPPCCEPCAICHCHLFQTVCYYKMVNPNC
ncbi:agouti-signaling protein-like isoform X2 [Hyla sarda]|uniref:agouti-signaling protein-like isoform X2 n=1 Tax=Hyla sarda TaxID=327740 RepID=UPI0024C3D93C|nr:agouti-signaling protein-like isoform X2 [Hyla sarda]